jgi:outer membrane protein TolC
MSVRKSHVCLPLALAVIVLAQGAWAPAASAQDAPIQGAPAPGSAPGAAAQGIRLEEFLQLARRNHPFFARESLTEAVETRERESLLGARDWSLRLAPEVRYLGEASSAALGGARSLQSAGLEGSLSRPLWGTGGDLSLSISSGYTRQNDLPLAPGVLGDNESYLHSIGLSYLQPLLRNFGGRLDRLDYELGAYTVDRARLQALENQESFLADLAGRYLEWAHVAELVRISEERLRLAQEQLEQVRLRYQSNLVDRVDVLRGEDAVRSAEQGLRQDRARWRGRQAELAVLAGSPRLNEAAPEFDLYNQVSPPDPGESVARLAATRAVRALAVTRDQLARQRAGLVEQRRPDLSLRLFGGLAAEDAGLGESFTRIRPDGSLSLELASNLGNSTLDARIAGADLRIRQIGEEMGGVLVDLEAALRSLLIRMTEMQAILTLGQVQIRSAQERTAEELRLYNQGRGQLTAVLQSRDNEQAAQRAHADNALQYQTLVVQARALLDELLAAE